MIPEPNAYLSSKSRAVLYHLQQSLKKDSISLNELVISIFDDFKKSLNKRQFEILIRKYDPYLLMMQIDDLFEHLPLSDQLQVDLDTIKLALGEITQRDNPTMTLEHIRQKSRGGILEEINLLIEIKNLLLETGDFMKTLDYFIRDQEGFMDRESFEELFTNIGFNDTTKRKTLLHLLLKNKEEINIEDFLEFCGLKNVPTRINLEQRDSTSDIRQNQISFIEPDKKIFQKKLPQKKDHQPKHIKKNAEFKEGKTLVKSYKSSGKNEIIAQKDIPSALKPYFNYNSVLEKSFAEFASPLIGKECLFIDPDNPQFSRANQWIHASQLFEDKFSVFKIANSVFNREKNRKGLGLMLEAHDIRQGSVGDCYYLSGIASIVNKYPQLLLKLFVLDRNPSHLYGVRLFIDGIWKTFAIDGFFPISEKGKLIGVQPHHQEIWVMLLEKAWAKHFRSYDIIRSGWSAEGLTAISGAPSYVITTNQKNFLSKAKNFLKNGAVMTCASSRRLLKKTKEERKEMGILAKHSYTLLDAYFDVPFKNTSIILFKIRNPWGRYPWKGTWSFDCPNWTPKLRKLLNYEKDPNDGSFFLSIFDFRKVFGNLYVSCLRKNYLNSWINIQSNRYNFHQTEVNIKTKGLYYFTIYQDSPRIYKHVMKYKKSKSWFFMSKIEKGKQIAIASKGKDFKNNIIQVVLDPGNYILFSRVNWKYWDQHSYTITSYGPNLVNFSKPKTVSGSCLNSFYESRILQGVGKQGKYGNSNILKSKHFSNKEGYGFISIKNKDQKLFEIDLTLNPLKGLELLQPHNFPLKLTILPHQRVTVKFLIDPNGFSYKYKEKYRLSKIHQ